MVVLTVVLMKRPADLLKKGVMSLKVVWENNLPVMSMEVGGILLALPLVFLFCTYQHFDDHVPNTYIGYLSSIKLWRIIWHNLFRLWLTRKLLLAQTPTSNFTVTVVADVMAGFLCAPDTWLDLMTCDLRCSSGNSEVRPVFFFSQNTWCDISQADMWDLLNDLQNFLNFSY